MDHFIGHYSRENTRDVPARQETNRHSLCNATRCSFRGYVVTTGRYGPSWNVIGKVLAEPAGANDGPLDLWTLDEQLALLRLLFSATGQENQAPVT